MLEWFSSLPLLGKVTGCYILFLAIVALYFWHEIRRAPTYADDDMRQRIPETHEAQDKETRTQRTRAKATPRGSG